MIAHIVRVALRSLLRAPFRTFLVLQGVIWGTALGVFPPAIIRGSLRQAERDATRLGTDRLLLTQETVDVAHRFDWDLIEQLRSRYGDRIRYISGLTVLGAESAGGSGRPPGLAGRLPLAPGRRGDNGPAASVAGGGTARATSSARSGSPAGSVLIATDAAARDAHGLELLAGRFFSEAEVRGAEPVCVLGAGLAADSVQPGAAVGQMRRLPDGRRLRVVGLVRARAATAAAVDAFGYQKDHPLRRLVDQLELYAGAFTDPEIDYLNSDAVLFVPHTLFAGLRPRWIEVRASPADVILLRDRLRDQLAVAGYEPICYVNAIVPVLYGETIRSIMELNHVVFVLCIVVGTSVVCAIMVLTVVERQREIAVRRVEGARRWHIALQFVVETGTVCTVGAVLGVPLGVVLAALRCAIEPLGSVTWTFPWFESAAVMGVVAAVGLAGGLLPAWRAVRVDPVRMLRYE